VAAGTENQPSHILRSKNLDQFRRFRDKLSEQAFGDVGQMFRTALDPMTRLFKIGKEVRIYRKNCDAPNVDTKGPSLPVFDGSCGRYLDFTFCSWAISPGP
jgi:hypothetical protein